MPRSDRPWLAAVDQDDVEACRQAALRVLDRAPQSRSNLESKLTQRGFTPEAVAAATRRFEAVGLLDDAALAHSLVRCRHAERGLARTGIAHELRRKGIPDAVAAAALEQITYEAEEDAALAVAAKALRRTPGLEPAVRTRRAVMRLARLGYGFELASQAVRRALAQEGAAGVGFEPVGSHIQQA